MSKGASYAIAAMVVILLGGAGIYAYIVSPTKGPTPRLVDQDDVVKNTAPSGVMVASSTPSVVTTTQMTPPVADGKFHVVPEQSTASFSLEEDLRGKHITVLGTTNQISGALKLDPKNLKATEFEPIRINARTFVTDNEMRNNAIRRMILKTEDDANEFIVFTPTKVIGTPSTATIGQSFLMKVVGNLTVSGVTKEVTFEGNAVFNSEEQVAGTAQTKVHYPDFGVNVPNLPFLANVDQDATLKIDFVAKK